MKTTESGLPLIEAKPKNAKERLDLMLHKVINRATELAEKGATA